MQLSVELPDKLATQLGARVESSDFDSMEEYVVFVLDEVTTPRPELQETCAPESDRRSEVHEQLESLGYLE